MGDTWVWHFALVDWLLPFLHSLVLLWKALMAALMELGKRVESRFDKVLNAAVEWK